ncbi:MAG TPA: pilin [Rhizobacter sp.]|nr:pilin [Rhizobacter sp.]
MDMARNEKRGFSLLELMAVVAVIAILATLAMPSLQGKIVRDQIVEAMPLANIAKAPVATAWALTKTLPADNAEAGLPVADKIVNNFVSSVVVENGAIHLTFGNRANGAIKGKVITLRPAVIEDSPIVPVTWVCGHAAAPDKMTIHGVDKTTVDARYLPLNCR